MKKIVCLFCLLLSFSFMGAQETFIVDGERLVLKNEVDGKLDLLWNIIDGNYRYFVRTESNTIIELKNTKKDGKFQEEYKSLLNELTDESMSTKRLNLTLFSLKEFIDKYNGSVDSSYQSTAIRNKLQFRFGLFGGITNNPFITNPDNLTTPLFGGELEVLDVNQISRHAVFLQLKHVLEQDELQYSTTEIALGYRFRFINKEKFSLYGNVKFATVNFSNVVVVTENNGNAISEEISDTSFDVPFIFGVGADIRVTENSYITLAYNELFALFLDNQGNFSQDFSVGYKFNL
ncbi:outer membrane beta-barrel protein [uncultured Psychroserpens sp.]|uniref:outer membrane beta-barrel protein n=1 Tax=uncultured Psychroserpens sp. TaxID=255436 RepID=UPI00263991B8|nr:outer membrane beta-barrel protein [uncultured Psychroserpens sp.]